MHQGWAGKIRYYACSNWRADRIAESDAYAKEHGYRGFISNQMLYNMGWKYMKPSRYDTQAAMDENMMAFHRKGTCVAMPYYGICSAFFHILAQQGEDAVRDSLYYTEGNLKLAGRIDRICREYGASITQVLLQFFFTGTSR